MNIRKLRVGNIVFAGDAPTIVRSITDEGINTTMDTGCVLAENLHSMRCVHSTLMAFGFEVKQQPALIIGAPVKGYYSHFCGMDLYASDNDTYYLKGFEKYPITSIDQVQNIAFALFNFDFNINLEDNTKTN